MKTLSLLSIVLSCLLVALSCASPYHSVYPSKLAYPNPVVIDSISLAYRYDVLQTQGNRRLAKKEIKHSTRVVAMRLTNGSSRPLTFGTDIRLYANDSEILLLTPQETSHRVHQNAGIYALYLLLSFAKLNIDSETDHQSYPIGLILGPGIAISQIAIASSANKKFKTELLSFNLINKIIQPGETVYGLAGLNNLSVLPLSPRIKP